MLQRMRFKRARTSTRAMHLRKMCYAAVGERISRMLSPEGSDSRTEAVVPRKPSIEHCKTVGHEASPTCTDCASWNACRPVGLRAHCRSMGLGPNAAMVVVSQKTNEIWNEMKFHSNQTLVIVEVCFSFHSSFSCSVFKCQPYLTDRLAESFHL